MPGSLLLFAPSAPVLSTLLAALDEGSAGISRRPLLVTALDLVVASVLFAARLLLCHQYPRFLGIFPQPPAFLPFMEPLAFLAAALPFLV